MRKKMPDGREMVTLGDIFEFEKKSGIKAGEGSKEGRYKFFTSSDTQSKFIDKFTFDGEHLIFSTGGSAGVHYCNERFSTSTDCFVVKVDKRVLTKFVYYFLFANIHLLESGFKGAGLKHISKEYLKKIKVVYPESKETQKQIVSILEKAESAKNMRQDADKLTKDYLNALFLEMFGDPKSNPKKWNMVPTQDLFDMKLGKMLSAKNYTGKHLKPYLRNINVQWGYLDLSDVKKMDFNDKEFPKYLLKKGDILVCEGGEVGRTAIYNDEIKDCCYQNALHRLRIKGKEIEPLYFVYFMFFAAKYGLIQRSTIQVTIARFTAEKFAKFKIMLPPPSLQSKFSKIVEQVEKLKEYQKQSKTQIDDLFNALMQRAFKGELA